MKMTIMYTQSTQTEKYPYCMVMNSAQIFSYQLINTNDE